MKSTIATLALLAVAMMLSGCLVPYWSDDGRGGCKESGYRDGGHWNGGYRDGTRSDGGERR